jgi:hypothetical protein
LNIRGRTKQSFVNGRFAPIAVIPEAIISRLMRLGRICCAEHSLAFGRFELAGRA